MAYFRDRTLGEVAGLLGCAHSGDAQSVLRHVVPAGSSAEHGLTFAIDEKRLSLAVSVPIGAVIVKPGTDAPVPLLFSEDPRATFGRALALFSRPVAKSEGVHPLAHVEEGADLATDAWVGPFAYIDADATVMSGAWIGSHVYVGPGCRIGTGCRLLPGCVLLQDVTLGSGCVVHPGAILGGEGFGFVFDGQTQVRVPQAGCVVVSDNVEVGVNSCVDRATCGDTFIGEGVKLDNLVQVAHNVTIGEHTVVAALAGISGSVSLGARCTLAGMVGVADQAQVTDDVVIAGGSAVTGDIREPGVYIGYPAQPYSEGSKAIVLQKKLPDLLARIRQLEETVKRLENGG